MSTCAICLKPAPAGYGQCRDCISTFGVKEDPAAFARERSTESAPKPWKLRKFEEAEKMEKQGDVEGLLRMHQEQEAKKLEPLRKAARANLLRMSRRTRTRLVKVSRNKLLRAPKYVWILLAVYLGCAAAEHLTMAGAYALDLHARITKGSRVP